VTLTLGTNVLVGTDMNRLCSEAEQALEGRHRRGTVPPLWDGRAGERIANILLGERIAVKPFFTTAVTVQS
jgi:UDP-N-acetylglucosamine 2-epimerase (non-hydrolysing)